MQCSDRELIRWCATVQTLVNCHYQLEENPVGDVESMQFVVQYLTKARSSFRVSVTTRAAAFSCSLSVTVLGALAKTV